MEEAYAQCRAIVITPNSREMAILQVDGNTIFPANRLLRNGDTAAVAEEECVSGWGGESQGRCQRDLPAGVIKIEKLIVTILAVSPPRQ